MRDHRAVYTPSREVPDTSRRVNAARIGTLANRAGSIGTVGFETYNQARNDGLDASLTPGERIGRAATAGAFVGGGGVAGGWAGGVGGAKAGALIGGTIGSVIPGAGTAAGAAVGGVVGGVIGAVAGSNVGARLARGANDRVADVVGFGGRVGKTVGGWFGK